MALTFKLDPRLFAHPASRPRLYLVLFSRPLLEKLGIDEAEVYTIAVNLMNKFCRHGLVPVDEFLLADDSPLIKELLKSTESLPDDEQPKSSSVSPPDDESANALWPTKHFDKLGAAWWRPSPITPQMLLQFPGLKFLSCRTRDYLASCDVAFPEKHTRFVELSQSVARARFFKTSIGCVTPRSFRWVTSKMRPTHGAENLLAQGLYFDPAQLAEFSSAALVDLAGNAFHAGCVTAATLVQLTVVGISMARAAARRSPQMPGTSGGEDLDDMDLDLDTLLWPPSP